MMNIGIIIDNLIVIFLMIGVGFAAGRGSMVPRRAQADFTTFLMNVTLPCTIFTSMIREFKSSLIRDSLIIFVLGILFFGGFLILSSWLAKLFRVAENRQNSWAVSAALCNTGFMGFPLVLAIFGEEGLFLASIMNLAYNCVVWTLGASIMCRGTERSREVNWKKIFLTNVNIAVALGLVFFIGRIPVHATIMRVLNSFGNITTPLSMFLIGLSLSGGNLLEVFTDRDVITISLTRLLLLPLLGVLVVRLLPLPAESLLAGVSVVIISMPCPSAGMILAQQYGQDVELASRAIFFSSLFCIVTIPLMMLLL